MPKHPPSHPGQGGVLSKKDAPNLGRDIGKGVAYAPDHDVLERGSLLDEGGLVLSREEVALVDELLGKLEDYCVSLGEEIYQPYSRHNCLSLSRPLKRNNPLYLRTYRGRAGLGG